MRKKKTARLFESYGPEKVTPNVIFKDFKIRHPRLSKDVVRWSEHGYLSIVIFMKDYMVLKYDYWLHKATILSDKEIRNLPKCCWSCCDEETVDNYIFKKMQIDNQINFA